MAFRYATQAEQEKALQKAEATAKKWLNKGYTPQQVAEGIWNHYGYTTAVKNGMVAICGNNRTALVY